MSFKHSIHKTKLTLHDTRQTKNKINRDLKKYVVLRDRERKKNQRIIRYTRTEHTGRE